MLGATTGICFNFSHRNKLGEINLTITFDQIYDKESGFVPHSVQILGLVLRSLALRKRPG